MSSRTPVALQEARVELARRIVSWLAAVVGLTLLTAAVFGAYNCTTDRPAREIFFEPREAPAPR